VIFTDGFENFNKASPEKRQAVINAGFSCFGRNGYKRTAMSEIAAAAGVSKPSLFHYFGSKKAMYLYLFRFSCGEIAKRMTPGTSDFFECIWIGCETKMRTMADYPGMYDFLLSIAMVNDSDLAEELRRCNTGEVKAASDKLYDNVDWSRIKPEVGKEAAIELVSYVSSGYIREHAADESADMIASKLKFYLDLLKRAIYSDGNV
jgi:AcrR family transcriptional regulator